MTRSIQHQFQFSHPPEVVWQYLTRSELMAQWLMPNNFQPLVGLDFQFRTGPIAALNFDGIFYCKVIEIVEFSKLSYSWKSGPGGGEITLDSIVTWKLEATESGTTLYLDHSGFEKKDNFDFYTGLIHGWLEKYENILKLLKATAHDEVNP